MQALKMFSSGQSGGSSGGDQNAFIGMAMSQAAKLWEQKNSSGNVVSFVLFLPFYIYICFVDLALGEC